MLLSLTGSPAFAASDEAEVVDGREGEEALAFRQTVERFSSRMAEFNEEARRIIQAAKAKEEQEERERQAAVEAEAARVRAEEEEQERQRQEAEAVAAGSLQKKKQRGRRTSCS